MNNKTKEWIVQYPNIRHCSIQTFSDTKSENKFSRILPMTDENLERCEKLQAKYPYGVYFSVNPMKEGKRDKESVSQIQTWICDIDEGTKEEQLELISKAPLRPTFVVESVHGFHLYYLSDAPLTDEQFAEWNLGIRDYYNWDIKVCKDKARVLRLPWFYHMKGEPVMVEWRKDLSCWMLYKFEEIQKAFPKKEEEKPKVEIKPIERKWDGNESYREKVNQLDNRQMLLELSGTRWLDGEIIDFKRNSDGTEQIRVNGKSRSCWLDTNWMIGSYDGGGPTWIQRVEWYLKRKFTTSERHEFAKRLDANHPELKEEKKEKVKLNTEEHIYNPTKVPRLVKPDFSRGSRELDGALGKMKKGQLIILLGETGAWKTTFATFVARMNKNSCYYVLEDSVENIASRYAMKRAWITVDQYNEGTRTDKQEEDYEQAYLSFKNKDIKMVDIGRKMEIDELVESIQEMKDKWHSLFFIDNLGFITGEWDNEAKQTADISHKLLSLCLQENICIVLLHHFKKKGNPVDKRDISQMRGSGKLWDDAFMVVEYIRDEDETFIKVYKDRTWGNLKTYEIVYDRGNYLYKGVYV